VEPAEQERLEQQIRERLEARQLEAAAELALAGYGPEILGYLVRVMGGEQDALEVYAQFCEDLWRGLERYAGRSSFRTWAYHLARNVRYHYWRDPYRRMGRRLETGELSKLQAVARTTTLVYRRTASKDRLAEIRQELDPEERELLILRVDRRMSWKEIAQVLAGDEGPDEQELRAAAGALRQRFRRLHGKLRELFRQRGLLDGSGDASRDDSGLDASEP
jgi:RNA polymerase sigma-70 factor (ECF subfamily)